MKILCIETSRLPTEWTSVTCARPVDFFLQAEGLPLLWIERALAETNEAYKQIIPYIVIEDGRGNLLCYPRHGAEERLRGLYSCGTGGHIDETDKKAGLRETVMAGMLRELCEEMNGFDINRVDIRYKGIINETESAVSRVHLGLVFHAVCKDGYIPTSGDELSGAFWKTRPLAASLPKEGWSDLALSII